MALTQAQIIAKLKKQSKGAFSRSKDKEPVIKGGRLPSGIIRGVARFSKGELGCDKDGVIRVSLTGIVIESTPPCKGAKARISIRFAEPKPGSPGKTIQQRMDDFLSNCQLLGVDTSEMSGEEDIPTIFEELDAAKPYFYFNTWQPTPDKDNPDPDVFVFIQGLADDYIPNEDEDIQVEDDGEEASLEEESEELVEEEAPEELEEELVEEEEEELVEEEEEWVPEVAAVYGFLFPKTKTPVNVQILVVDAAAQKVKVKRLTDNKVFAGVPFDKLTDAVK